MNKLTLYEQLNNEEFIEELSKRIDEYIQTDEYKEEQEKFHKALNEELSREYELIRMTDEKFNRPFSI